MSYLKLNARLAAEAKKRRHRALLLRDKGKSWAEIGVALGGISRTRAQQLVKLAAAERQAE
jgi:hypothetical protein